MKRSGLNCLCFAGGQLWGFGYLILGYYFAFNHFPTSLLRATISGLNIDAVTFTGYYPQATLNHV
jgi:hypothetical protein